jgi:hypothetical protein
MTTAATTTQQQRQQHNNRPDESDKKRDYYLLSLVKLLLEWSACVMLRSAKQQANGVGRSGAVGRRAEAIKLA